MGDTHAPAFAAPVIETPVTEPVAVESERSPAPGPSLTAAIFQAKLSVGPASDPFEDEADRVADKVVQTLRVQRSAPRLAAPIGTAPADPRVRRMMHGGFAYPSAPPSIRRIQRMATVGIDGGDVDANTEKDVRASRGVPMPKVQRTAMEGAFGTTFGYVRMHVGSKATELNDRIQAKAFTTGNDIFFRDGIPDTSSSSGQHLLAHELTHTIQQGGAGAQRQVQRSGVLMRKWWKFGKSDPKPVEISGPLNANANSDATQAQLAAMGYGSSTPAGPQNDPRLAAMGYTSSIAAGPQNATAPAAEYAGEAGNTPDAFVEAAKPAAVVTVAGVAGASTAGALGDVGFAGGVGGGVIGVASVAGAAMELSGANAMHNEAQLYDDAAMNKQARLRAKDQGAALGTALTSTARGAATTIDLATGGAKAAAEGAGATAAGATAGALGIATGSAMIVQGAWRGGKAVVKLFRLTQGRAETMLSAEGERWKRAIVGAEQFKVAINALKIAAGALGVAAGALMLVSNPIGWAVGLAAAIVGGVYAASKLIARIRNARDKMNAHAALAGLPLIGDPTDVTRATGGGERSAVNLGDMGYNTANVIPAGPQNAVDTGSGMATATGERSDDSEARLAAIEQADEIAVTAGKNARIAAELRDALGHGDKEFVFGTVEAILGHPEFDLIDLITAPADQRLFDAFNLLSAINIDPEEALADSGQALIEQKLSKAEAM